jgi:hypothetical protein
VKKLIDSEINRKQKIKELGMDYEFPGYVMELNIFK